MCFLYVNDAMLYLQGKAGKGDQALTPPARIFEPNNKSELDTRRERDSALPRRVSTSTITSYISRGSALIHP